MEFQELSEMPGTPELVITTAVPSSGMDLLGLRSPAESVAYSMLNGITTVTPNVRYLSIRAWVIFRYAELKALDDHKEFMAFAHKVECSLVLGNLLNDHSTPYLIGKDSAVEAINSDENLLELKPLVKAPAMNIYAGPSQQLKIAWRGKKLPGITEERGLPLAMTVNEAFQKSEIPVSITPDSKPQAFPREKLKAFGNSFQLRNPSGKERELLINFIIPDHPSPDEISRISTYCLILYLCQEVAEEIKEEDVFRAAIAKNIDSIPPELHESCEGWARFAVRDMLVASHEAAVCLVVKHIVETSNGRNRKSRNDVLAELTSEELTTGLAAFGFPEESIDEPIADFCRLLDGCLNNIHRVGNINRWDSSLDELAIIQASKATPASMVTLPMAWWIAVRRMEPGLQDEIPYFDLDGYKASARIGVRDVILPEVNSWSESTDTVRDVVARILARSVDQHLRIAWSRLAREPWKDVSVLGSDGDEWFYCHDFSNGQATSRLYQAISWLRQLGLIDDAGLSPDGHDILQTRLAVLRLMRNQSE